MSDKPIHCEHDRSFCLECSRVKSDELHAKYLASKAKFEGDQLVMQAAMARAVHQMNEPLRDFANDIRAMQYQTPPSQSGFESGKFRGGSAEPGHHSFANSVGRIAFWMIVLAAAVIGLVILSCVTGDQLSRWFS